MSPDPAMTTQPWIIDALDDSDPAEKKTPDLEKVTAYIRKVDGRRFSRESNEERSIWAGRKTERQAPKVMQLGPMSFHAKPFGTGGDYKF